MHDERSRIEYAALLHQARDADRLMVFSWLAPGVVATTLLAWGISSHSPGFMVSVVLTAAAGFLAMAYWRERAATIAGYLETYHESESDNPSFFNRLGRLKATLGNSGSRDWQVTTFFNAVSATAAIVAWIFSKSGERGEMWAGIVTACALGFASYSFSETSRSQQTDAAAQWRRADSGLREVKRRLGGE
jgi:hypothetical protein